MPARTSYGDATNNERKGRDEQHSEEKPSQRSNKYERALLFTIFVTQFFTFYNNQFTAIFGLIIALLTYVTIRLMIREEEAREESWSLHESQGSAPGRLD